MKQHEDQCAVRDQFCDRTPTGKCERCKSLVCEACALDRVCHTCLRAAGADRAVQMHLDAIGGAARRAKPRPWSRFTA